MESLSNCFPKQSGIDGSIDRPNPETTAPMAISDWKNGSKKNKAPQSFGAL